MNDAKFKEIVETLNNSLYVTYEIYQDHDIDDNELSHRGMLQAAAALEHFLKSGDASYFAIRNGARENVLKIENEFMASFLSGIESTNYREDIRKQIAEELIKKAQTYTAKTEKENDVFWLIEKKLLCGMSEETICNIVANCIKGDYIGEDVFKEKEVDIKTVALQLYIEDVIAYKERENREIEENTLKCISPNFGVNNLKLNEHFINYCREDIITNKQIEKQNQDKKNYGQGRRTYKLEDMVAVTDVGKNRETQQDSVLMLYHPTNPKYKMLIVADGAGKHANGARASIEIVQKMLTWFEGLSITYFTNDKLSELKKEITQMLNIINKELYSKYKNAASTFAGIIVGENTTVIATVGDSRVYMLDKKGELHQMTEDDNPEFQKWVQEWCTKSNDQNHIEQMKTAKNYLRFHKKANIPTKFIGNNPSEINPHFREVNNSDYVLALLFSDGITDLLSDEQINAITQNTDFSKLAEKIVNKALSTDSNLQLPNEIEKEEYYKKIYAGKDNATVAAFRNESENHEGGR